MSFLDLLLQTPPAHHAAAMIYYRKTLFGYGAKLTAVHTLKR
jgi:hypothetical protein